MSFKPLKRIPLRPILACTGLAAFALLLAMFAPAPARIGPESVAAQSSSGADLYATHCSACHQANGEGIDGTFPPLAGNQAAADADYVTTVIVEGKSGPLDVLGVSYDSAMPPIAALPEGDVPAVVEFVVGIAGGAATSDTETADGNTDSEAVVDPIDAPEGDDVDRGHDLFVGSDRLDNGGVACASCHIAGGVGNLGGSSLGPDLTDVFDRLGGEAGLSAWLINPPSETMAPIFGDDPITEGEISDLVAFLGDAPNQDRATDSVDWLTIAGLIGLVVLLGGMAVAWRGMRQTYRETLRSRR